MVYPGVGWVLWRTCEDLPEALMFKVAYLGQEHVCALPTCHISGSCEPAPLALKGISRCGSLKLIQLQTRSSSTVVHEHVSI